MRLFPSILNDLRRCLHLVVDLKFSASASTYKIAINSKK